MEKKLSTQNPVLGKCMKTICGIAEVRKKSGKIMIYFFLRKKREEKLCFPLLITEEFFPCEIFL